MYWRKTASLPSTPSISSLRKADWSPAAAASPFTPSVAGRLASKTVDTLLIAGAQREHLLRAGRTLAWHLASATCGEGAEVRLCVLWRFYPGRSGVLDGRRVTTHWDACGPLAHAFPSVKVDSDALYVVDGPIWTSAGVTTGIDMVLAMVAHDLDAGIAGQIAKGLVLYARRPGYQSQFSPLLQAQAKADEPFCRTDRLDQANLVLSLDVSALAARAGLSERTFHRQFVAATGETPARFVESARLDAARMLLSRDGSLKSVAAQVGLAPAARFAEAFERRFGVTPRLSATCTPSFEVQRPSSSELDVDS